MKGTYTRVPSQHLGRRVHMWSFGTRGQPVVVFPSAAGMAHEWQASDAVGTLTPLLEAGRIRLICPESNVSEAWTGEGHPDWRLDRHRAYERFIAEELIPAELAKEAPGTRVATTGCSFGAFYAANFALKHPDLVEWALCISGRYRTDAFMEGFYDDRVYFADPLHYVPNLSGEHLERARRTSLTLVVGTGAHEGRCIQETHDLAWVLGQKGIPHRSDIWGRDAGHHWYWWRHQIKMHLGHRYG
ncbi:MAG: esterase [Alphaproteobacteria bacterium]|nr:esterase [Alphaproteobacteria bacterium]